MTLRNAILGVAAVFGLSVWAWSRPAGAEARPPGVEVVVAGAAVGGNHDEAAARFRTNQARHWRQVAIGR